MSKDLLRTKDARNENLLGKPRAFHKLMRSQSEKAGLFACCTFTGEIGISVEGETVFRLEEDVLKFSGSKRWNTELI